MSSQTIYKSYKFRLYPDADQTHTLAVWFGCVRFVKNKLISNFNSWSSEGPNRPMTEKILKDDPELPWLKEAPAVILQQARMDVDQTKKLAKKEKGSKSYERARIRVARLYARITRIRNDYYHNISTWLVSNYDAIYVENLNVNGMLKNHRMARAIQEAAWSTLVSMISYKSIWYGKTFHQIDRWYPSSKTCSCCGHKVDKLPLDIREWTCPNCGTHHDRDINAAINIKNQGQLDCYDQLLSDGTADMGYNIPMRLGKYASKTERSKTPVLVGIGTDEDTRSLVVY